MAGKSSKKSKRARQVAALPIRKTGENGAEVLLVTSRDTGRWIIPKGWPMAGKSDAKAAAQEALEEAGVTGKVAKKAIGRYRYDKVVPGGEDIPCRVTVYLLAVEKAGKTWPEADQRERRWMAPEKAAELVQEGDLGALILKTAADFAKS